MIANLHNLNLQMGNCQSVELLNVIPLPLFQVITRKHLEYLWRPYGPYVVKAVKTSGNQNNYSGQETSEVNTVNLLAMCTEAEEPKLYLAKKKKNT
ncbi:Hypothetical predicted protein [Podarcis lilfordi]|uniref:Uncharacterized protein n=1 Tax=Podarcis lilfordi TaxID=74358 RepID=A0AA35KXI9_9SAUR|nr:Hypothetical predicted protein [Podarcis lilfordi]